MTQRRVPVGDTVTLSFVHHGKRLSTTAHVASCTDDGLGIRFIEPSAEFCEGINALIRGLLQKTGDDSRAFGHQPGGTATWSYASESGFRNLLRRGKRSATLSGLSFDGAALESRHRPDVDQEILIFLKSADSEDDLHSEARVVRHTDKGFAVQFNSPSVAFRRAVSELRRSVAP